MPLYNCVCSFQSGVKLNDDTRLADIVPEMDAEVLRTLQPEAKLRQMVQQMSWVYKGRPAESTPAHQAEGVPDG